MTSRPARRFSAQAIFRVIKRQSWILFVLTLGMIALDYAWQNASFMFSKNFISGGVLAWLGHSMFAGIALRTSGYHRRRQVVNNFYLAQAVKWLMTLVGFAVIFIYLKPLNALWVFIGYFSIQLSQVFLLYYYDLHQEN